MFVIGDRGGETAVVVDHLEKPAPKVVDVGGPQSHRAAIRLILPQGNDNVQASPAAANRNY